jgi:hypothetical protein
LRCSGKSLSIACLPHPVIILSPSRRWDGSTRGGGACDNIGKEGECGWAVDDVGRPDLAIAVNGLLVGYIELKAPGHGTTDREFQGGSAPKLSVQQDVNSGPDISSVSATNSIVRMTYLRPAVHFPSESQEIRQR